MIFDPDNPTTFRLERYLRDEHDRLNFPDMWHKFCTQGAIKLLEMEDIEQPDCVAYCELADAGRDDAMETWAIWPRGWDIRLSYELTCPATGEVWAKSGGPSFVRPELGVHPIGQFVRRNEGRIYLVDMRQQDVFGVFVTPTAAEIEGRLYEMVLKGRWNGTRVVPIENTLDT